MHLVLHAVNFYSSSKGLLEWVWFDVNPRATSSRASSGCGAVLDLFFNFSNQNILSMHLLHACRCHPEMHPEGTQIKECG